MTESLVYPQDPDSDPRPERFARPPDAPRPRRVLTGAPSALRWLTLLGPGIIASIGGDDAGGIATTSVIGAQFGYSLLWLLVLLTAALAVVQELSARLGAVTGRGLLDLVRERFGIGWAIFSVAVILLANAGTTVTEFVGIGAAAELFHVSRYVVVPVAAGGVWLLVLYGNYRHAEKIFLAMALVFVAYPITVYLAHPDWANVLQGAVVPRLQNNANYWLLVVAMIGAAITPYQQMFQQSAVVEKKVPRQHYGIERIDATLGAVLGNVIWVSIVIATGATLHSAGIFDVQTASDAAQALQPVAGSSAATLFAIGLLGASLLAASVVPLTTAYAVSEAFGFRKGVDLDFRRAPIFFGLFTALVVVGITGALIPGIPVIPLLVGIQVLNGVLLPAILAFILVLAGNRKLMGSLALGWAGKTVGWTILLLVSLAAVVALVGQLAS